MTGVIDISIIIVNWNAGTFLTECINSINRTIREHRYEILVVDNASTDGSLERARDKHPGIITFKNRENLGFARGNNLAMPHCKGRYILLLNPDTVLVDDAVETMVRYLDAHSSVGAIGPELIDEDGNSQPSTAGSFPTLRIIFNEAFGLTKVFPRSSWTNGLYIRSYKDEPLEVDWISGACLLVRREVIDRVGVLDGRFFMYFEDQEWCCRIRKAGYKIVFFPPAKVVHYGNQSVSRMTVGDFKKNQISCREYLLNFNGPFKASVASKLYFLGILARWLFSLLKYILRRDRKNKERLRVLTKFLRLRRF